jgi:hypothetical protein
VAELPEYAQDTEEAEAELLAKGFERRFLTDEPRLSESIELYEELGFEVLLRPLAEADLSGAECTECMKASPERYRIIYTRIAIP